SSDLAALDGWWGMPREDVTGVLGPVDEDVAATPSRVLWVGQSELLPGRDGWPLGDHLAYTASTGAAVPGVADLWPTTAAGASERLGDALDLARRRATSRLGRVLAPLGVQYVAVSRHRAPTDDLPADPAADRAADELVTALSEQLDLEQVGVDRGVVVFRNTVAAPLRHLAETGAAGERDVGAAGADPDLRPVLVRGDGRGARRWHRRAGLDGVGPVGADRRRRAGRVGRGRRLGRPVHGRTGRRGPPGAPHHRVRPRRARRAGRPVGRGRRGGAAHALRHAGPAGRRPRPAPRRGDARGTGERGGGRARAHPAGTRRARRARRGRAGRARPARRAGARRVGGRAVTGEPAHVRGGRRRRPRVGLDRHALVRRVPALLALGGLLLAGVATDRGGAGGEPAREAAPGA